MTRRWDVSCSSATHVHLIASTWCMKSDDPTRRLRPGAYVTPNGNLSPLQAQVELARRPNYPSRSAIVQIDANALADAGFEIPPVTRVPLMFGMAGGGYEVQFPYAIPPQFLSQACNDFIP